MFVVGDFNLRDIHWDTLSGSIEIDNSSCELIFELNLSQLINCSAFLKGNINLDLIITNSYEFVNNVLIDKTGKSSFNSDHYPITFSHITTYSKANMEGLSDFLLE